MPDSIKYLPLNVARPYLLDCDVLSYRTRGLPWDPIGKLIAVNTGPGQEVHTAFLCRENGDNSHLVAIGMRLGRQKLKLLDDEVADSPGLIDVYRYVGDMKFVGDHPYQCPSGLTPDVRHKIVNDARVYALHDRYGVRSVVDIGLYFVPVLRWFIRPPLPRVADHRRAPFCTMLVDMLLRQYALPLLNHIASNRIVPGYVPLSPRLLYLFTLMPERRAALPIEHYFGANVAGVPA